VKHICTENIFKKKQNTQKTDNETLKAQILLTEGNSLAFYIAVKIWLKKSKNVSTEINSI
jgi:hypothetical protein